MENKKEGELLSKEWYIIQTFPGCENSAKTNLERRIKTLKMEDKVFNVLIPERSHIEKKKNGEDKIVIEKVYPGYIFVEMICDDDTWFKVRNTPMVTGLLGSSGKGTKPVPLAPDEINPILKECGIEATITLDFEVGDKVLIKGGNFEGQYGTVDKIDLDNQIVTVLVDFFGRLSPTELHFYEVQAERKENSI